MYQAYIKFEGIEGSATDEADENNSHVGWSRIESWTHGFTNAGMTQSTDGGGWGMSEGKADHNEWVFNKFVDKSSHQLLKACWDGFIFGEVKIQNMTQQGGETVMDLEIIMNGVKITSLNITPGMDELASEDFSLAYEQISYNIIPLDPADGGAGNTTVGFDRTTNKLF